jgi:hypothetical protein
VQVHDNKSPTTGRWARKMRGLVKQIVDLQEQILRKLE